MQDISGKASDKQFLHTIVDDEYKIPDGIDYFAFAKALLANFASTDGELRDDLSYMILAQGIIDKEKLSIPQMEELLSTCLDQDHLFCKIGEKGTDSVFVRSFSNLIIAALLYTDAKNPQFSLETILQAKAALLRYAKEEKDWRGYVERKGWAHAMAHLADSLDECAQNLSVRPEDRQQIMETVRDLAKQPVALYHEEDVRLATVAYHIIVCKQLDDEFISSWLESCYVARDENIASWTSLTNIKNFLRSLYFHLVWDNIALNFVGQISGILKRIDAVYVESADTLV